MEIDYKETSKDLLTRIDIHEKYGTRNIDEWTVEVLKPRAGFKILDVGCGAGKQCFLYSDYTKGQADITGGDFSEELLEKARARNTERGDKCKFVFLDFNTAFEYPQDHFDLLSSAFAIYYASD
ncbi:MAG TPA: class I SAM-dependent methyltransferase, partial [Anaerolineales bacterium]